MHIFSKFIALHDIGINWTLKRCYQYMATQVRIRVIPFNYVVVIFPNQIWKISKSLNFLRQRQIYAKKCIVHPEHRPSFFLQSLTSVDVSLNMLKSIWCWKWFLKLIFTVKKTICYAFYCWIFTGHCYLKYKIEKCSTTQVFIFSYRAFFQNFHNFFYKCYQTSVAVKT